MTTWRCSWPTTHDGSLVHARFGDLPEVPPAGDLLVVNTSATLPAALPAELAERAVELRLSTPTPDGTWLVELRGQRRVAAPLAAAAEPDSSCPAARTPHCSRRSPAASAWRSPDSSLARRSGSTCTRHGRPIRYGYVPADWPLDAYQTVFALEPGSAEMPSAARPFTTELVTELVARGVLIAPITLHTGVSSPELGEPPYPERYQVPEATARIVNAIREWGGQMIAVGTTVVRALETTAQPDGTIRPGQGWTNLVVSARHRGPHRRRAADRLARTSRHTPADPRGARRPRADRRSYREAAANGYRLHEFGDLQLILTRLATRAPSRDESGRGARCRELNRGRL